MWMMMVEGITIEQDEREREKEGEDLKYEQTPDKKDENK